MREKNLCKSRWSTYNKCTQWAIKSLEKYNFQSWNWHQIFFPSIFCLLCIILIVIVVCIVIHSMAKSEMYKLSPKRLAFFKFGPRWPKRTHYKLFMSTDDKYTSISKSVLIENYLLIRVFVWIFFINSCENLQIRPQINS